MNQYPNYQQPWQPPQNWQNTPYSQQPVPAQQPAAYSPVPPQPVPAQYGYVAPQPVCYAPPFTIGNGIDPRVSSAGKTVNHMNALVLLQLLVGIVIQLPIFAIMAFFGINIQTDTMALLWISALSVPFSTALPFFVYLRIGKKKVNEYLQFEKVGFVTFLLIVLAGFAICLAGNFPAIAVQNLFGVFGYEPASALSGGSDSWAAFALEFFTVAVLVPVMEEFAFRGVMFSALKKHGTGFAIVASALIFSLAHLDFSNVLFAFIAGLVFGFIYAKTKNLWLSVVIHMLVNGTATVGTYAELLFGSNAELMDTILLFAPIIIGIIALVILLIAKRDKIFAHVQTASQPLTAGESAKAVVRAPVFWCVVFLMAVYTASLFL